MSTQINPTDWVMEFTEGGPIYPFVEDENANITGLGHQDKTEFAAAINRYDADCNGEPFPDDEQWDASDIGHGWATLSVDGEWLRACSSDTPDAIAITTLWNAR